MALFNKHGWTMETNLIVSVNTSILSYSISNPSYKVGCIPKCEIRGKLHLLFICLLALPRLTYKVQHRKEKWNTVKNYFSCLEFQDNSLVNHLFMRCLSILLINSELSTYLSSCQVVIASLVLILSHALKQHSLKKMTEVLKLHWVNIAIKRNWNKA